MSYTKGPWTVRDIPSKERYVGPSSDGGAPSVAIIPARASRSDAEQAANAKLIASAPDLLAALRDCEHELEAVLRSINTECVHFDGDEFHDRLGKARAAISRATGEQP